MIKNLLCLISDKIRTNNVKKPWSPTPQGILNETSMKNANLYNLRGWIIVSNARLINEGYIKLSKNKQINVMKICDDLHKLGL